jgi:23S rRNA (uracil1939-C5)-methyltransferase
MLLSIEKLVYGGDGLARMAGADGRSLAVFVPFVLPGEKVEAELGQEKAGAARGFARASVSRIVEPSPERVAGACPHFEQCGGCHYQHIAYERQVEFKAQILRETLERVGKIQLKEEIRLHRSPPWNYRNRTRMKVTNQAEFAIGYFEHGSHRLLPVEHCPISSPLINRALRALWQSSEFRALAGEIAEVQFFASHDDRALLLEIDANRATGVEAFRPAFERLQAGLPELRGLALFQSTGGDESDESGGAPGLQRAAPEFLGERELTYVTSEGSFQAAAGAFFQTNRFLVDELLSIVLTGHAGRQALDLYAGVGLFSVPLSRRFERVTAVEIAPLSVRALRANSGGKVAVVAAATEQFLRGFHASGKLDLVVADPPRAGLGEKTARMLARFKTAELIYVSCDPATLSRDLRVLVESGFHIEEAHLVDLFPQTFHIETVFRLAR